MEKLELKRLNKRKKEVTYSDVASGWTRNCYYYPSFENYAKKCFGLTLKKLRELKKLDK